MLKSVLSKEIQIYVKTNIVYKIYLAASCLDLVSGLKQVVSCLICPQAHHAGMARPSRVLSIRQETVDT
jgi:hypothetical protein